MLIAPQQRWPWSPPGSSWAAVPPIAAGRHRLARRLVAFTVGPVLGAPTNWFALYLGPAIVVELLALTPLLKRPDHLRRGRRSRYRNGRAVAGVAVDRRRLHVAVADHHWPEALVMAVPVAVLTGICGAMVGMVLTGPGCPPARSAWVWSCHGAAVGAAAANGLRYTVPENADAPDHPHRAPGPNGQRLVTADVRFTPADLVSDDPNGCRCSAGRAASTTSAACSRTISKSSGPGTTARPSPMPVSGTWKTLLRVQDDRTFTAVPIYPGR